MLKTKYFTFEYFVPGSVAHVITVALQTLRTLHFDALSFSADDLLHLCLEIFLEVSDLRSPAICSLYYTVQLFHDAMET
jgi:hypothetical protein